QLLTHFLRRPRQRRRALAVAERIRQGGRVALRPVNVGLHFAKRDRPLGHAAILMEYGVVGVLPALIGESLLGLAVVLEEAIAVAVAVAIDPFERRLRI